MVSKCHLEDLAFQLTAPFLINLKNALTFFNDIFPLVFDFHSIFDVGRSMFDVHLLIIKISFRPFVAYNR
jgi:hypothetical protein